MNKANPKVDGYIRKNKRWSSELQALREIILTTDLIEDVKWRVPCYTLENRNVVFIGAFKESCVLSFVKGALLKDVKNILIQQTANSQSVRVIRFADVEQIGRMKATIKAYVEQAVAVEKAGLKVKFRNTEEFPVPEEFQAQLEKLPDLKAAFQSLTPGRQRGYLLHFASAKQSKTRSARVEKWMPQILAGKGLDD